MKVENYRKLEKVELRAQVPDSIDAWYRVAAARRRITVGALLTEMACQAKGEDPARYGIAPPKRRAAAV